MILAPISYGELVDKITILEIKLDRIQDLDKRRKIHSELELLAELLAAESYQPGELKTELRRVNEELWHIEDFKRSCETAQNFGPDFIEAARAVYQKNDLRARIKAELNRQSGSVLEEVKSHRSVDSPGPR